MLKKLFRRCYAMSPSGIRVRFGRAWKLRGTISRMTFSKQDLHSTLTDTNLFFLIGSGRCGTLLISRMLNQVSGAMVLHEPHRHCDLESRPAARKSDAAALQYVQQFRQYEIAKSIREHKPSIYGEISSPLRAVGGAMNTSMPHAKFFILVRNGKATVRSAMNRQMPKSGKTNHTPARPLAGDDPYVDTWDSMTQFEKACWWWMDAYRTLLKQLPDAPIVYFDKIVKDYDYLDEHVLKPVGINLTREQYETSLSKKSNNAAKSYNIPHWDDWDDEMNNAFDSICGDTMKQLGFE